MLRRVRHDSILSVRRAPSPRARLLALAAAGALAAPVASAQAPVLPGGDSVTSDNVTHVGKFPFMGDGIGGRVIGDIFYATSTTGLSVFDLSDPGAPKQLGTMMVDIHWENEDVPTNGKVLAISASSGGTNCPTGETGCLNLYDVSNPASPTYISSAVNFSAHTAECVLDCTWFYGSEGQIVDARDVKNPKMIDVNWAEKAIEQGYDVTQVPANPHDVTEVAPGIVLTATDPMFLLDVREDPSEPKLLATTDAPGFVHGTHWPNRMSDRFALAGGEAVGPACDGSASATLQTYDTTS